MPGQPMHPLLLPEGGVLQGTLRPAVNVVIMDFIYLIRYEDKDASALSAFRALFYGEKRTHLSSRQHNASSFADIIRCVTKR